MFTSKKLSTILALSMLMSFAPSLYGLNNDIKTGIFIATTVSAFYSLVKAFKDSKDEETILETNNGRLALASALVAGYLYSAEESD